MKSLTAIAAAATMSLSLAVSANVVTITFDSQLSNDSSGLNSTLLDFGNPNWNQLGLPGGSVFWEDFDVYDASGDFTGCGFTQFVTPLGTVDLEDGVTGSYSVIDQNIGGKAAAPNDDDTCYLVTPNVSGPVADSIVDFGLASLLTSNGGFELDYLGMYWGSIDGTSGNTDSIQFFDANDIAMNFQYLDENNILQDLGDTITGDELLNIFDAIEKTGDQGDEDTNLYVNFFMQDNGFKNFALRSTGRALEIDNVVARTRPVPAPGTLALLGFSLIGLGLVRKKARK